MLLDAVPLEVGAGRFVVCRCTGRVPGVWVTPPEGWYTVRGGAVLTPGGVVLTPGVVVFTPGGVVLTPGVVVVTPGVVVLTPGVLEAGAWVAPGPVNTGVPPGAEKLWMA